MPRGRHDPATEAISGEVRGFPTENLCSGDLGVFFCGAKPHHNSATASAELTVKSIAPCIDRTTAFGQTPITSKWPTSRRITDEKRRPERPPVVMKEPFIGSRRVDTSRRPIGHNNRPSGIRMLPADAARQHIVSSETCPAMRSVIRCYFAQRQSDRLSTCRACAVLAVSGCVPTRM